jgi:hypothetical protein
VCKQWLESLLTLHKHTAGDLNKARAKTRNRKWNRMKKGTFIDKLGYVNLLDAITHVEIRKKKNQLNEYSITSRMIIPLPSIIRSVFYSVCVLFRVLTNTPRFVSVYNFFSPVFLPFRRLSGENNCCKLLISARS